MLAFCLCSGVPLSSIGLVTGEILAQISALEELNQAMADHRPIQQANLLLAATVRTAAYLDVQQCSVCAGVR